MLVRIALSIVLAFTLSATSLGQSPLSLDMEKSKIEFVGSKPPKDGKSDSHTGGFKEFSADAKVVWDSPEKSTLAIEIKTASIFTDNAKLTDHLKNPDFFDVKKFPVIKFESTKIVTKELEGEMTGKLTMLDKTVEVTVPYKVDVNEKEVVLKANFKLDRTKWGMNYGAPSNINAEVEVKTIFHFKK